jgi:hypothetical protein
VLLGEKQGLRQGLKQGLRRYGTASRISGYLLLPVVYDNKDSSKPFVQY